ncbi:uncharacterized protein TRAVEDRAFT_133590, partial [Trametes versicolor FP-101664 SS1]|uniref:uncharacterized protein n=1 Tax=Trametes versicolor (strain FP-101664) TaxID=717944 RepID=UPI0004624718
YTRDDHLAVIYDRLGPFPIDFVRRCTDGQGLVDSQDAVAGIPRSNEHGAIGQGSLEKRVASSCQDLSTQDVSDLCRFLRKCFTIDPLVRPTVSELLADAWLTP